MLRTAWKILMGIALTAGAPAAKAESEQPAHTYAVKTPGGFTVSAFEWGNPTGPEILFIHGAYQSALSWKHQIQSPLAARYRLVAYDLLGHGQSDKPNDPKPYRDGKRWAEEIQAVIEATHLRRPVLVAWSFGGRVGNDYLSHQGEARLAGVVYVAATTKTGPGLFHPDVEKLDADAMAEDPFALLRGTRQFLLGCVHRPWDTKELEAAVAYNSMTPPYVRRHISGRPAEYHSVLAKLEVPVLAIHGDKDRLILPAMSEYTVRTVKNGRLIIYPNVGHSPFMEEAARFNQDLDAFLRAPQKSSAL